MIFLNVFRQCCLMSFFSQKRLKEYKEHTIDSLLLIDPGLTQPSSKRIGPSGSII